MSDQNEKGLSNSGEMEAILSLAAVIEAKDPYTAGHAWRVAAYGRVLGSALALDDPASQVRLTLAGYLHDIGKLAVPDEVLNKPSGLTDEEFALVRRHPVEGYDLLRFDPVFGEVLDVVLMHHEAVDGSGYPAHLKGELIPLEAKLFAIVDTFDAMTSNRSYRQGRLPEDAIVEILEKRGTQFEPQAAEAFTRLFEAGRLAEILGHSDADTPVGQCPTCGPTIELRRFHKQDDRVACRICGAVYRVARRNEQDVELGFTGIHLGDADSL